MAESRDRERIRAVLGRDPEWGLYALCDLGDGLFAKSRWYLNSSDSALVLLYEGGTPAVLFGLGVAHEVGALMQELPAVSRLQLQLLPAAEHLLPAGYRVHGRKEMWRMTLREPCGAASPTARSLSATDLDALHDLYADGDEQGETPDFFAPWMLDDGFFFGVERDGRLVSAAGTHVVAPEFDVAAVGNVYTRRAWRGRGFGTATTAAVTRALSERGIGTIGLNVNTASTAAVRMYEGLGYRRCCRFIEAIAEREG